jgi:tetratricopeptide (TPR) repeat protein
VIRPVLARLGAVVRRRRRPLLVLALLLLGAALAGPRVLAWYHWHAAQVALERYQVDEARSHLASCLRAWPDSPRVRLLAARAARLAGAFEEAEQQLSACEDLQKSPSDEARLERSLLRAAGGDFDDALEDYLQDQARKDPEHAPLIWEALAQGYVRVYRLLDAFACLDRWLRLQPDCAQALFLRGETYRQGKSLNKAVPEYRRAVELDPQRDDARRWLAVGLQEIGRYEEALGHLEYLRRRDPDDAMLLVHVARCTQGLGRTDEAARLLDGLLARQPRHGYALKARGQLALTAGHAAEAERWLRDAVRELPHDYQAQWSLWQCLQQQGKETEAQAELARAKQLEDRITRMNDLCNRKLALAPHDPGLHYEFGTLRLQLGYEDGETWLLIARNEYDHQGNKEKADECRRRVEELRAGGRDTSPKRERGEP